MELKVFDPDEAEVEITPPPQREDLPDHREAPKRKPKRAGPVKPRKAGIPRCSCGCGRKATWGPEVGAVRPLFYSRLCGYTMACKMVSLKLKGGAGNG